MSLSLPDLRIRLDQMTERIVSRLKDRSRFPLNAPVYEPNAVPIAGRNDISFLEFSLEGLESYHAALGRYSYPGEYPIFSTHLPESAASRTVAMPPLPAQSITIRDDLITFYLTMLPDLCPPGEDPDTFGETVYVDADLLELLHERINVGRYVAQAKIDGDSTIRTLGHEPGQLAAKLTDPAREAVLLQSAHAAADRYEVDPALVERVFEWIMQETVMVEVAYIRGLQSPLPEGEG